MTAALVFLGAAVGAPLRYLTDRLVQSRNNSLFPWGTFSVNLAGCLTATNVLVSVISGLGVVLLAHTTTIAILG